MGHRERKRARLIEQFVPPEYSSALHSGWAKALSEGRVHGMHQRFKFENMHASCVDAYKTATQLDKLKLMKLFEFVLRESVKARLK